MENLPPSCSFKHSCYICETAALSYYTLYQPETQDNMWECEFNCNFSFCAMKIKKKLKKEKTKNHKLKNIALSRCTFHQWFCTSLWCEYAWVAFIFRTLEEAQEPELVFLQAEQIRKATIGWCAIRMYPLFHCSLMQL